MNLPNKVYDAEYANGIIYYVRRRSKYEQPLTELKLPKWLQEVIEVEKKCAAHQAEGNLQKEIRTILGL